jgi:hypothetical protein
MSKVEVGSKWRRKTEQFTLSRVYSGSFDATDDDTGALVTGPLFMLEEDYEPVVPSPGPIEVLVRAADALSFVVHEWARTGLDFDLARIILATREYDEARKAVKW